MSFSTNFSGSVFQEYAKTMYNNSIKVDKLTSNMDRATTSLANRFALFTWQGLHGSSLSNIQQYYRDNPNGNPLVAPIESRDPNATRLVEYFSDNYGGIEYSYSDFLYCKYHRKIPNNHMITLRRFPTPCEDNIYDLTKSYIKKDVNGNPVNGPNGFATGDANMVTPDIARAVTWMSDELENKMEDILTFSYGYNWREQEGKTNTYQSEDGGYTAQPFYARFGPLGRTFLDQLKGITAEERARKEYASGFDALAETYPNFVFGPINVINKMMTRDQGLNYERSLKLKFVYELKSYDGINPKVAMLDILANLLVLTYNNANFFGGAHRFYGAKGYVASQFGDPSLLANGQFRDYVNSVVGDLGSGFNQLFGGADGKIEFSEQGLRDAGQGLFNIGKNYLTNVLGSFLNDQVGAVPGIIATQALLTGESTGNWHLTIGNPMNPIAMYGNLILENSQISLKNGLGRDDFPTELHLDVTLKDARPRDAADIMSAFNGGNGRMYASSQKLGDVLNIEGKDVKVYGAVQRNSNGRESISSAANGGITNEDLPGLNGEIRQRTSKGKGLEKFNDGRSIDELIKTQDLHVNFG
jgi:hypothetical protein